MLLFLKKNELLVEGRAVNNFKRLDIAFQ